MRKKTRLNPLRTQCKKKINYLSYSFHLNSIFIDWLFVDFLFGSVIFSHDSALWRHTKSIIIFRWAIIIPYACAYNLPYIFQTLPKRRNTNEMNETIHSWDSIAVSWPPRHTHSPISNHSLQIVFATEWINTEWIAPAANVVPLTQIQYARIDAGRR